MSNDQCQSCDIKNTNALLMHEPMCMYCHNKDSNYAQERIKNWQEWAEPQMETSNEQ